MKIKNTENSCACEDGTMKSYEKTLAATIPWAMKEYKITEEQTRKQMRISKDFARLER